jgi:hypothetical protein
MPVDMSPEAIAARLRQWAELTELCISLGKAKPMGQAKDEPEPVAGAQAQAGPRDATPEDRPQGAGTDSGNQPS